MTELGPLLRSIREKARLTQEQLGKKIGVDGSMISRYETNKVKPELKILQALVNTVSLDVPRDEVDKLWEAAGYVRTSIFGAPVADPVIAYIQQVFEQSGLEVSDLLREDLRTVVEIDQAYIAAKKLNRQKKSGTAVTDLLKLRKEQEHRFQHWFLRTDIELGHAYYGQGHFTKAILCYERALWAAEELNDLEQQGSTLLRLGDAHRRHGKWKESIARYGEAIEVFSKIGSERRIADCWRKQAGTYLFQGQPYQAEPLCIASVEKCISIEYTSGLAKGYQHLAWVCYMTGQWDEGIVYAQRALAQVEDSWERIKALRYLGDAYRLARKLEEAEEAYLEALELLRKLETEGVSIKLVSGLIHLGLGKLYLKLPGHEMKAGECFDKGFELQSALEEDFRVADFLEEQGAFLLKKGRLKEAEMRLSMARDRFWQLGNIYYLANTLVSYCALYETAENLESLLQTAERARNLVNERGLLNFHLARIEFIVGKAQLREGNSHEATKAWCVASDLALRFNSLSFEEVCDDVSNELLSIMHKVGPVIVLQVCSSLLASWREKLENKELDAKRYAVVSDAVNKIQQLQYELEVLVPVTP